MSLSVTEASAVNTLLRWVMSEPGADGKAVSPDDAKLAARTLAGAANRKLMAGIVPADVVAFPFERVCLGELDDAAQLAESQELCWLTTTSLDRSEAAAYGVGRRILAQRAARRLLKRQREEAAAAQAAYNDDRERETLGYRTEERDYDRDHQRPPRAAEFREEAAS